MIVREKKLNGIKVVLRALLSLYLVVSIPFRWAFLPEYSVIDGDIIGFVMMDLISTAYFSFEVLNGLRELKHASNAIVPLDIEHHHLNESNRRAHNVHSDESKSTFMMILLRVSPYTVFSVMATLPFEYIYIVFGSFSIPIYCLMNRLIRILFLPIYANDISNYLAEKGIIKNLSLHRTWKLFFTMALAGHWCGCVFYYIAKKEALSGNEYTWPQSIDLYELSLLSNPSSNASLVLIMNDNTAGIYIQSLYWAYITMVS